MNSRLIPHLARIIVQNVAAWELSFYFDANVHTLLDLKNQKIVDEIHALSSVMKAKCSWYSATVIQTCREVLAGHGYSTYNRLGALYADNGKPSWKGRNLLIYTSILIICFFSEGRKAILIYRF